MLLSSSYHDAIMDNPGRMKSIMFMSLNCGKTGTSFSIKLRDECITFQVSGSDLENTSTRRVKRYVKEIQSELYHSFICVALREFPSA